MAGMAGEFCAAISPILARSAADTLAAELLPLLDACKFLERNAERVLASRMLGSAGRPFWLRGVHAEVRRDALGHVLVIAPSNFPLFLPGVQVLQGLAAGNSVTWKPGAGGGRVAQLVAEALRIAGLPGGLLSVSEDTVEAAYAGLAERPDKVVFTGSAENGKDVLFKLAESATPAVMELSGADAVIVLPAADLARVAKAVAFGLRLNGGAVCMSPRRLLALGDTVRELRPLLLEAFAGVPPVVLQADTAETLRGLLDEAVKLGAKVVGTFEPGSQRPVLVDSALPTMAIAHADVAAPVVSLMTVSTVGKFEDVYGECEFALTVAIFGPEDEALALGGKLRAGVVLVNDLIVPTADPRVPFGGRGASGFGSTRGEEGLLEMTAAKTVLVRRGGDTRHYEEAGPAHAAMFEGAIRAAHGAGWWRRLAGVRAMLAAVRKLR